MQLAVLVPRRERRSHPLALAGPRPPRAPVAMAKAAAMKAMKKAAAMQAMKASTKKATKKAATTTSTKGSTANASQSKTKKAGAANAATPARDLPPKAPFAAAMVDDGAAAAEHGPSRASVDDARAPVLFVHAYQMTTPGWQLRSIMVDVALNRVREEWFRTA